MIRIAEHLIFGSLAVAGHLAVFGITGGAPGPGSAMDGPAVIMEAAPIELAALVQRFAGGIDAEFAEVIVDAQLDGDFGLGRDRRA